MAEQFINVGLKKIPDFTYKGIKKIKIPKKDVDFATTDFGKKVIVKYFSNIMAQHLENRNKIDFFYNYFLGEQDIRFKERPHKVDKFNNNKIIENHSNRQVEFKVGFLTGEKRDYTHKADSNSDDLIYLDRYFTDCNFFAKDKTLKKWIYATGIGITHTAPRTDIIINDGIDTFTGQPKYRYATEAEGFNVDYNAPFTFNTLDPRDNFVVYSSDYDNTPLFCVSIVDKDISTETSENAEIVKEVHIETRYGEFVLEADTNYAQYNFDRMMFKPKVLHYLPMIEYSKDDDRMGLVELNRSLFNTINLFRSAIADMTEDSANAILVFKNVDIDAEDIEGMKEAGAIVISDSNASPNSKGADLDTIKLEIPFDGLNQYIDQLLTNCYDIAGVPLASGQVTSGGDTGQARLLGGGWNNAYIIINNDITALIGYDYDELKLILQLCKDVPNCKLNELYASQIDINYRVNQNDNFLVKTQGMRYLYEMNMPLEFILKVSKLSNDIKTDAKDWQERIDQIRQMEIDLANNGGNNSQEIL